MVSPVIVCVAYRVSGPSNPVDNPHWRPRPRSANAVYQDRRRITSSKDSNEVAATHACRAPRSPEGMADGRHGESQKD